MYRDIRKNIEFYQFYQTHPQITLIYKNGSNGCASSESINPFPLANIETREWIFHPCARLHFKRTRLLVQVSRSLAALKNAFPARSAISHCEKHPLKLVHCIKQCSFPFMPPSNTRKQLRVPANIPCCTSK